MTSRRLLPLSSFSKAKALAKQQDSAVWRLERAVYSDFLSEETFYRGTTIAL
jgi:hypothetical protein